MPKSYLELVLILSIWILFTAQSAFADDSLLLSTRDGFSLELTTTDTSIQKVELNSFNITSTNNLSGFAVLNYDTKKSYKPVVLSTHVNNNKISQIAKIPEENLDLETDYIGHDNYVEISGTITSTSSSDKAIIVTYSLPVNAINWYWEESINSQTKIETDNNYQATQPFGSSSTNIYPFSSLSKNDIGGVTIAVPIDNLRLYRINYDSHDKQFSISYEFGLTGKTTKFPNQATFNFILYKHDPKWGFRSTAKKYYNIYPHLFINRLRNHQGEWVNASPDVSSYGLTPADLNIKYHEIDAKHQTTRVDAAKFDDQFDVLTFPYHLPGRTNICLTPLVNDLNCYCPPETSDDINQYKNVIEEVTMQMYPQTLDYCNSDYRNFVTVYETYRAVYYSGLYDSNDQYIADWIWNGPPYGNTRMFYVNVDPDIPYGKSSILKDSIEYELSYDEIDGIYLDDLHWADMTRLNFREEHFQYVDYPLIFDYSTKRPVLIQMFSMYEFLEHLSEYIREKDKYLIGNLNPSDRNSYPEVFFTHFFDVVGGEAGWGNSLDYDTFALHRTLSYQKPYTLLVGCGNDKEQREIIAKRALHFGIFPGNFFHTGGGCYDTTIREHKDFLIQFTAIEKQMAEAGWEPITHAKTENGVLVERFGYWNQNSLYFTFHNKENDPAIDKLIIDTDELGISLENTLYIKELFSNEILSYDLSGSSIVVPFSINPKDTLVIKMESQTPLCIPYTCEPGSWTTEELDKFSQDCWRKSTPECLIYDHNCDGIIRVDDIQWISAHCLLLATPTPPPIHCQPLGDIDCSQKVNALDLSALLSVFGTNNSKADLDDSGKVNALDLSILLGNFGKGS